MSCAAEDSALKTQDGIVTKAAFGAGKVDGTRYPHLRWLRRLIDMRMRIRCVCDYIAGNGGWEGLCGFDVSN